MDILLISYGDYEYDGRLRELMNVFSRFGKLHAFTRGKTPSCDTHHIINCGYPQFIWKVVRQAGALGNIDILALDNRKSVIPGLILKKKLSAPRTVLDCRELYIANEVHHITEKLGCYVERYGIRAADTIICANEYRAAAMQDIYGLAERPLVYENLRALQFSSEENKPAAKERFARYDVPGEYRIVFLSGCSFSRMCDVLVNNLDRVRYPCRLFLVGSSTGAEEDRIRAIISEKRLDNVQLIEQLDQDALKALIDISHIGIVSYHQKDQNNKYCASGKIFEFIYEGLPVVTTTNPPLKQLCDETGIGVADDEFFNGINSVLADYDSYRQRVAEYAKAHTVGQNNEILFKQLADKLR